MTRPIAWCVSAMLGLGTACGDGLMSGAYVGEPLHVLDGIVRFATDDGLEAIEVGAELRVALFWSGASTVVTGATAPAEEPISAKSSFPARFRLPLYEPPRRDLLARVSDGSGQYTFALVLAYLDANRNGVWDRTTERLVGGTAQQLILYTPDGISSPTLGVFGPGFHRVVPRLAPCVSGSPTFEEDRASHIDLVISMTFPASAVLDIDCSGDSEEWSIACPPLATVRAQCGDNEPSDPGMCEACGLYLAPTGELLTSCDAWLSWCIDRLPEDECLGEYDFCRSVARDSAQATGCPPLWTVRVQCTLDPADPMCSTCAGSLAPTHVDSESCTAWYSACVDALPPDECLSEYGVCMNAVSAPDPTELTCDMVCACDRTYQACTTTPEAGEDCSRDLDGCLRVAACTLQFEACVGDMENVGDCGSMFDECRK